MQVVAVTRVLDEADIVEAFARHTAAYVDHHVFLDNGSTDGTLAILQALHRDGLPLTLLQARNVSFSESGHLTQMFRIAIRDHGADWVACLDADEFLDDRGSAAGLRDLLQALTEASPSVAALHLPMTDYVSTAADDPAQAVVPLRMRWRREPGDAGKVVARSGPDRAGAVIMAGGHTVLPDGPDAPPGLAVAQAGLRLAHYSERSLFQFALKAVRGWSRVLAADAAVQETGAAYHYQAPFEALRDRPADLLRHPNRLAFHQDPAGLAEDPIAYLGGPLRHTAPVDDAMRTVRGLTGLVQNLALRHRRLLETFPEVRRQVAAWDAELMHLL